MRRTAVVCLERKAFAVLAAMGEASRPALRELLRDDSVRVRYQAARVLGLFQ